MKSPFLYLAAALFSVSSEAAQLAYESFEYAPGSALTTQAGGGGWLDAWFHDGASAATHPSGLNHADALGNVLTVSGGAANTASTGTTRSLRDFAAGPLNEVWVSFLYQLPGSNNKFEGVSFYRGAQQLFSVSNPSTTATASMVLTNNINGSSADTQQGVFGLTQLVVLKLTKGGGSGGTDRIDLFVDPLLTGSPSQPAATVEGSNFDFDRVRLAGQDGASLLVDELRVGETFADVTPHTPASELDSDGDGLTNAQEVALGLNPFVSDAELIANIQAQPAWFGLYTSSEILALGNGGVIFQQTGDGPLNFTLQVQQSEDLSQWDLLESLSRQFEMPAGKRFLRINLSDR